MNGREYVSKIGGGGERRKKEGIYKSINCYSWASGDSAARV